MIKYFFVFLIDLYRYCISPYTPHTCRFYPTCSNYARESILTFGIVKGGYLAVRRLLKCHPYHVGGFDPVPSIKNQDI
jgi:putative membrane protein insertion efficiency factor